MIILLGFAFISGLITILAPCIWPLLPIILSASSTNGHRKPLGITLGIMTSFTVFTLTISYIVKIIPFDPNILRLFAVIVIGFLGFTLVIPKLSQIVEGFVSKLSSKMGPANKEGSGFSSGFLTGFSLGIVWSPCAGPILATIATLAATQAVSFQVVLVTIVYVIGVGIPLFFFASAGQKIITKSRSLNKYTGRIQQVFGVIMILTAVAIFTNFDKTLQAKLLDIFPSYGNFQNQLESNSTVKSQLDALKGVGQKISDLSQPGNYGQAPEFVGITKWLNLPDGKQSLSMSELKGKVVLIDFWTYTCINCIRTLPHVTSWYDKYKDKGFVVVGVHAPEFEFEHKTENVLDAIKKYNIHYPVAQDNDFATWKAYNNQFWPAEYLIDAKGVIRHTHFGEGEYDQTEQTIQALLKEAGQQVDTKLENMPDTTPKGSQTPETYVGLSRMGSFGSNEGPRVGVQTYTANSVGPDTFAFKGDWNVQPEFAEANKNAQLLFRFNAEHVYLVMHPGKAGDTVKVYLDDKLVGENQSGADVKNGVVTLDTERLYDLIDLHGKQEQHLLRLEFDNGIEAFAFTFG